MLFIEFDQNLSTSNLIKYRNVENDEWYYLYIDIETLNLLIQNFGIISTQKIPTTWTNCDNESTSKQLKVKYCGAEIEMFCGNNTPFYLAFLEQNY